MAALAATIVELLLRTTTLERTTRVLGIRLDLSREAPVSLVEEAAVPALPGGARRSLRATVTVLARGPFRDTCLRRCLVLGWRLRHLDPALRIGAARGRLGYEAHAWLVVGGRTLDAAADDFVPLVAA